MAQRPPLRRLSPANNAQIRWGLVTVVGALAGISESVSDTFTPLDLAHGTRKVAQKWRGKIFPAPDQEGMIPQKLLIGRSLRLEPAIGFEPMTC